MTEGVTSPCNKAKLDKAGLNEVLIQLRKPITQAKVHVIHKLTKNISALKKKKAKTELEKSKNDRKVARFVQEVQVLRREPKDTIARWLVANEMSLEEVTNDKTDKLDVRLRAVVRVSEHKAVRKILEQFRLAHPHWKSRVPKLLKTLGKKRKKEDPNEEPIGIKKKIDKVKDKNELKISKTNNVDNSNDSDVETKDEEEMEDDVGSEEDDMKDDDGSEEEMEDDEDDVGSVEDDVNNEKNNSVTSKKYISNNKKEGQVLVQVLDLNNDDFPITNKQKTDQILPTKSIAKKSSFFLGGESEEETDDEDNCEDEDDEEALQSRQENLKRRFDGGRGRGGFPGSGRMAGFDRFDRGQGRGGGGRESGRGFHRGGSNRESRGRGRGGNRESGRGGFHGEPRNNKGEGISDGNLHPSWAAKKKSNIAIAQFQGKKTSFSDESTMSKGGGEVIKGGRGESSGAAAVHPSWAAKQNQKSSIQAFQGKKMVFDD